MTTFVRYPGQPFKADAVDNLVSAFNVLDEPTIDPILADNGPGLMKVISRAAAVNGTVYIPANLRLNYSTPLNLDSTAGLRIIGASGVFGTQGSQLVYTGAGALPAISAKSAFGLELRNLNLGWNNPAYTGDFINCDWAPTNLDVNYLRIANCLVGGTATATGARSCVRLNHTDNSTIKETTFLYGAVGVRAGDGATINASKIEDSIFSSQTVAGVLGDGTQALRIRDNTFEPLLNGKAGGVAFNGTQNWGLNIEGNWFGDVSTTGGTYILARSLGGAIIANRCATFAGIDATHTHIGLGQSTGLLIAGNRLEGGTGIDAGPSNPGNIYGATIVGNEFIGTTTDIANLNRILTYLIAGNTAAGNAGGLKVNSAGLTPTVTGSRAGNAALASALTGLANQGLIIDNSTA